MPLVKIEARKEWGVSQKKEIIDAVHMAMRESIKIPENDRNIRFIEYHPEDFEVPPGKSDNYIVPERKI